MSLRLMSSVWESAPYSQTELLVLLALADHANDEGVCWPAVPRIAKRARTSERHVRRVLARLEADGWIAREPRINASSVYRLTPPDTQVTPDTQVRGGGTPVSGEGGHPGQVTPDPQVPLTTREPSVDPSSSTTTARPRRTKRTTDPLSTHGLTVGDGALFLAWLQDKGSTNPAGLVRSLDRTGDLAARISEWRADTPSRPAFWDRDVSAGHPGDQIAW